MSKYFFTSYTIKQILLSIIIVAFFVLLSMSFYSTREKVIKVQDGDSLTVFTKKNEQKRIRLYGIDAPEYHQYWGPEAQQFTYTLAYEKEISLQSMGTDQYNRELAVVILPSGKILNEELIREGHAWVYTHYCKASQCKRWKELEKQARKEHKGLWIQKNPLPPWVWRKKNKHQ